MAQPKLSGTTSGQLSTLQQVRRRPAARTRLVVAPLVLLWVLSGAVVKPSATLRASAAANGAGGDNHSQYSMISGNGRFIAFQSDAANLVPGDSNGVTDIFLWDSAARSSTRVSVSSAGAEANGKSYDPAISSDGRFVAFHSQATNLVEGDTNAGWDVFVHDMVSGSTVRVSVDSSGNQQMGQGTMLVSTAALSGDGRLVVFNSPASNLVAGDTNGFIDVFLHDLQTGSTTRLSVAANGAQANAHSYGQTISADGSTIAFESDASNLVIGDTGGSSDIFVCEVATGSMERASTSTSGEAGNNHSFLPAIAADGKVVAFESYATNLVANDTNGLIDVFVRDRKNATTTLVSISSAGVQANRECWSEPGTVSADGRFVCFYSDASNLVLGDTNSTYDVFVRDRSQSLTNRVSLTELGGQANGLCMYPSLSALGDAVSFTSWASNLVSNDTNGKLDIFVRASIVGVSGVHN